MLYFRSSNANQKQTTIKQTPWLKSTSELYRPSDRRLSAKLAVSEADPYGRNHRFLDRSLYVFFQAAPQKYSRGWEDSVQTHYFSGNLVAPGMNLDLWICSQNLWPPEHRGDPFQQCSVINTTVLLQDLQWYWKISEKRAEVAVTNNSTEVHIKETDDTSHFNFYSKGKLLKFPL
jgi:hypothetical protein